MTRQAGFATSLIRELSDAGYRLANSDESGIWFRVSDGSSWFVTRKS